MLKTTKQQSKIKKTKSTTISKQQQLRLKSKTLLSTSHRSSTFSRNSVFSSNDKQSTTSPPQSFQQQQQPTKSNSIPQSTGNQHQQPQESSRSSKQSLADTMRSRSQHGGKPSNLANKLRNNNQSNDPTTNHTNISDLSTIVFETVAPPPQYAAEVPKLISGLRQVIAHDGPVTIGKIDDTTPYLDPKCVMKYIPQPDEINWEAIPPFITSSRDPSLLKLAETHGAKFMGSTSSTSPLLSQIHFALTSHAPIKVNDLSHWFANAATQHTRASVKPSISLLRKRNEIVWGIDNAPSGDPKQNQILIDLGKSLERHLTYEWDDFKRIFVRQFNEDGEIIPNIYSPEEVAESEAHAFLKSNHLLLRSQLDCEDDNVPSDKKVFDLKTRATLPIRLDVMNHNDYVDYKITTRHGLYNSYEREYYDMGRSAFLKYSFQCRIGGMGGIMVAYHNTRELFGFEYIPVEKMDRMIYGSSVKANFVFRHSLNLLEELVQRVTTDMGDKEGRPLRDTIRLHADSHNNKLIVFAEKFPTIDLDDPEALDQALSCHYRGHIYIDWLSEEQARAALERRGLSTEGSRPHLISRLESACIQPTVLYTPPSEEFIQKLLDDGMFKIYNLHLQLFDEQSKSYVQWQNVDDGLLDTLRVGYSIKEVSQVGHTAELARRFSFLLHEAALVEKSIIPDDLQLPAEIEENIYNEFKESLQQSAVDIDGNPLPVEALGEEGLNIQSNPEVLLAIQQAKRDYMNEIVDSVELAGVSIPLTRSDQHRLQNKKIIMNALMQQVNEYNDLESTTGSDRLLREQEIKKNSFQGNRAILRRHQLQQQENVALGLQQPPQEPSIATSRRTI